MIRPAGSCLDGAVELYCCTLDDDRHMALGDAVDVLDAAERGRMSRFVFPRDRHRFARGRGFVRLVVGTLLDRHPAGLRIETAPGGKPVFPGAGLDVNLSHAGDLAVLAVSRAVKVGIDLERAGRSLGDGEDIASLARHCMVADELAELACMTGTARANRFLAYWTAKEARMKVHGEGMQIDPRRIALDLRDGLPVGYADARSRGTRLTAVTLPDPAAICHLATAPLSPQRREPAAAR